MGTYVHIGKYDYQIHASCAVDDFTGSGVARSLVLAGHLLYACSSESNNTSARARSRDFGRAHVRPGPAFATPLFTGPFY